MITELIKYEEKLLKIRNKSTWKYGIEINFIGINHQFRK